MVCVPLSELVARTFLQSGVRGAAPITQHLTLWVCFLGAALAAREGRLLSLATGQLLPEGRLRSTARVLSGAVAATVAGLILQRPARASWVRLAATRNRRSNSPKDSAIG